MTHEARQPGDPQIPSRPSDEGEHAPIAEALEAKGKFLTELEAVLENGGVAVANRKLFGGITGRPLEESVVRVTVKESGEHPLPLHPEVFLVTNFGINWRQPEITLYTGRQRHEYEAVEGEHADVTDITLQVKDVLPGLLNFPMHPIVVSSRHGVILDTNRDRYSKEKTYGNNSPIPLGQGENTKTGALVVVIATGQDELMTVHGLQGRKADWDMIFENGRLILDPRGVQEVAEDPSERAPAYTYGSTKGQIREISAEEHEEMDGIVDLHRRAATEQRSVTFEGEEQSDEAVVFDPVTDAWNRYRRNELSLEDYMKIQQRHGTKPNTGTVEQPRRYRNASYGYQEGRRRKAFGPPPPTEAAFAKAAAVTPDLGFGRAEAKKGSAGPKSKFERKGQQKKKKEQGKKK